ncbi:hypothetical protein, unlikely [Trypanosoma brucei gambiense DAL972]|uniref:Uncharacterized protein n=1 Tax=Trypanosoma brucei gambiense (strain MHOM/CI/86/DAL972) TaxID=679716 RepID=D0A9L8_TRYB9|nr:hypothetical protein, unlikely [Trypanosoma brucei gambiense DAL972]CBH18369.1 hypothetical protein, unlikely [Trypanosoma brucei gambiense DAL972]|eukprot:XP_011780633.1 hypothetical protein, unlikely [Trypanosoma brucei gambiense DAL972]
MEPYANDSRDAAQIGGEGRCHSHIPTLNGSCLSFSVSPIFLPDFGGEKGGNRPQRAGGMLSLCQAAERGVWPYHRPSWSRRTQGYPTIKEMGLIAPKHAKGG